MKLTIFTEGFFDSAHFIKGHDGKCAHLHGHSWKIEVHVSGDSSQLDANGILWDFGNIKKIISKLDHRILNEEFDFNPTAENLVKFIYTDLKSDRNDLSFKVRVYENCVSKTSYCEGGDF